MTRKYKGNNEYESKTYIVKQEYIDIINGLSKLNNMDITNVLEQIIEHSLKDIDDTIIERAKTIGRRYSEDNPRDYKNIFQRKERIG